MPGKTIDEQRAALSQAIAAAGPQHTDEDDADDPQMGDAILTGYVICAEWVDGGGEPWMSKLSGDVNGKKLAIWREEGLLHHALFGDWSNGPPSPED